MHLDAVRVVLFDLDQFIIVQGVFFGLGGSMLFLPGCALVNQYFDKRKGTAMSVIIGAASFGGIIWPLILQSLFDQSKIGSLGAFASPRFSSPSFSPSATS